MKINSSNAIFWLSAIVLLTSCSGKHRESTDDVAKWKEMDEFHLVMVETFHPYSDSGNLEPAFRHAVLLDSMAGVWNAAALPSKVDNDEVKQSLAELKSETANLVRLVNEGDSAQVGSTLNHAHDIFHHIMEGWHGEGGHAGEEGHR